MAASTAWCMVSVAHFSLTMHLVTSKSETPENLAAGSQLYRREEARDGRKGERNRIKKCIALPS